MQSEHKKNHPTRFQQHMRNLGKLFSRNKLVLFIQVSRVLFALKNVSFCKFSFHIYGLKWKNIISSNTLFYTNHVFYKIIFMFLRLEKTTTYFISTEFSEEIFFICVTRNKYNKNHPHICIYF